ncbi:hypothetical protein B484DRAFT_402017, partial [Ochromonadaceae sp. CCMP2298]
MHCAGLRLARVRLARRTTASTTYTPTYTYSTLPTSTALLARKKVDMDWDSASPASTLVIVESPAKARTIQNFVDKDTYVIDFCAGHIRDLAKKAKE